MPTYTVGTSSRDYSTLQSAEDAVDAVLTADWVFNLYNDSEFTATGNILTYLGHSGSFFTIFQAATGQSFKDGSGFATNPMQYDASKGVAIRATSGSYYTLVDMSAQGRIKFIGLQFKSSSNNVSIFTGSFTGSEDYQILQDILAENGNGVFGSINGANSRAVNVSTYFRSEPNASGAHYGITLALNAKAYNCQMVIDSAITPSNGNGLAYRTSYSSTSVIQNCAAINFFAPASATGWDTTASKNNAATNSSGLPGTANQHSITYTSTSPFTDATGTTYDLRPVAATVLDGNGSKEATEAPNDIIGTVRASACTIGTRELVSVASSFPPVPAAWSPLFSLITM